MNRNKTKVWKVVGITAAIIIVGLIGVSAWFSNNYKSVLRKKLPGWVAKATDSMYKVSFEDIDISLINRDATVQNLRLWPDSAHISRLQENELPATTYDISIPELKIKNISWADIIADKDIVLGELNVEQPDIKIRSRPELKDSLEQKGADSLLANEEKKQGKIGKIKVGRINVHDPKLHYNIKDSSKDLHFYALGGTIELNEWEFNPQDPKAQGRFLYAREAQIAPDSFMHKRENGVYEYSSGRIEFSNTDHVVSIQNFKIRSPFSKEEFYERKGRQIDMFDMEFPVVKLSGFQWQMVMDSNKLVADSLLLEGARIEDYFTRLAPPNTESKLGKFPNQLLLKLPIGIHIPKVTARDCYVAYTEVNEKTKRGGTIAFGNVNGHINNLTNIPSAIAQNGDCIIDLYSNFNGGGNVHATFNFSLRDSSGAFTVDAMLKNASEETIQSTARALALIEVNSLQINSLDMHVEGDEQRARGDVSFRYSDLKVSLLGAEDKKSAKPELDEKNLISFLANNLLVYPDNPMEGEEMRHEHDAIERDPYKSFFNLIWKSVYNSILKSALRSDAVQEAIEDGSGDKKEKKGFFRRLFGGKDKE